MTLGVLWRPHRAEAPEVTAQWRANWFSYQINRSPCQSQAKLMARVFSSALLGMFAWCCPPDTGAPAEEQGEILKNSSSHTATTFMKTSHNPLKYISQTISAILLHWLIWVITDQSHTSHAKVKLTTKQLTRLIF